MTLSLSCLFLWVYHITFCKSFKVPTVRQVSMNGALQSSTDPNRFDAMGLSDIGNMVGSNEDSDPYAEISWRKRLEVSIAKSQDTPGFNYLQLATIDSTTNEPRCRSIVFRGFLDLPKDHSLWDECGENLSTILTMVTDARSNKINHTRENPIAEVHWWFGNLTEQYRIRGNLVIVDSTASGLLQQARLEKWERLTDAGREAFFRDKLSGGPYEGESVVPKGGRSEGAILPPPDSFVLILLAPQIVDYLRLQNLYRQTNERDEKRQWKWYRVNV